MSDKTHSLPKGKKRRTRKSKSSSEGEDEEDIADVLHFETSNEDSGLDENVSSDHEQPEFQNYTSSLPIPNINLLAPAGWSTESFEDFPNPELVFNFESAISLIPFSSSRKITV